jgi:hypothetical protein
LFTQLGLVRVRWQSPDPATLAARLAERFGFMVHRVPVVVTGGPAHWWIEFPSGRIEIGPTGAAGAWPRTFAPLAADDRLGEIACDISTDDISLLDGRPELQGRHPNGIEDLLAVGWATVDLDRTVEQAGVAVAAAPNDPILGARVRIARFGPASLVLLEPTTEGRLAASLARHGEGPVAIYLSVGAGGLIAATNALADRGEAVGPTQNGPFGPSVRLRGGPVWGPHLVLCQPRPSRPTAAGTIRG